MITTNLTLRNPVIEFNNSARNAVLELDVTMQVTPSTLLNVQSLSQVANQTAHYSEALESVIANKLPSTVIVTLTNGGEIDVSLEWTCESYDRYSLGSYTFIGTLQLPDDIGNPNQLRYNVQVLLSAVAIESIANPIEQDIALDTEQAIIIASLPSTVAITLQHPIDGNNVIVVAANWNGGAGSPYDASDVGQTRIIGLPNYPEYIINPLQLEVQALLNVKLLYVNIPSAPVFADPVELSYANTSTGNIFTSNLAGKTDIVLAGAWSRVVANGIVGTASVPQRFTNKDATVEIGGLAHLADHAFKSLNGANYCEIYGKSAAAPLVFKGNQNGLQWNAQTAGAYLKAVNIVCKDITFAGGFLNVGSSDQRYADVLFEFFRIIGSQSEGEGMYQGETTQTDFSYFTKSIYRNIFVYLKGRDGGQWNNHLNALISNVTFHDVGKLASAAADQRQLIQLQNFNGIVKDSIFDGAPALGNIFSHGVIIRNCYFRWKSGPLYIGNLLANYTAPLTANNQPIIIEDCIFDPEEPVANLIRVAEDDCNIILRNNRVSSLVSNDFSDERVDKLSYSLQSTGNNTITYNTIDPVTYKTLDVNDYANHGLITTVPYYRRGMGYCTPPVAA